MVASVKINKNHKSISPVKLDKKSSKNGIIKLTKSSESVSGVKVTLKKRQARKVVSDIKPLSRTSRVTNRHKKLVQPKNNIAKIVYPDKSKNKIAPAKKEVLGRNLRKNNSKNLLNLKPPVDKIGSKAQKTVIAESQGKKAGQSSPKTKTSTFKLANKAPVLKSRKTKLNNPVTLGTRADKLSSRSQNKLKAKKPESSRSKGELQKSKNSINKTAKIPVLNKVAIKSRNSKQSAIKSPVKPKTVPKKINRLVPSKIKKPVTRQSTPKLQEVKTAVVTLPASNKPVIESSPVITPEKMKKLPDRWSECGQVFFTHGQAFGISPNLRTVYIGSERDIEAFLEHGKFGNELNRLQKDILSNIREYRNTDSKKLPSPDNVRTVNSKPVKQKIKARK